MLDVNQFTDAQTIEKILQGEVDYYEVLIRRNNPFLYRIGRAYHFNHEDTEDLMQEAFIDGYTSLSKFENRSSFKTWIVRIMLHRCYRKRHKASYKNEMPLDIYENSKPMFSNTQDDTNRMISNRELHAVIEKAVLEIPESYRVVFTLREMNNMSVKETAETLDISEANVKVRLNRAKAMLRKEIERTYDAEEIFEFNLIYCDGIVNNVMSRIREMSPK